LAFTGEALSFVEESIGMKKRKPSWPCSSGSSKNPESMLIFIVCYTAC